MTRRRSERLRLIFPPRLAGMFLLAWGVAWLLQWFSEYYFMPYVLEIPSAGKGTLHHVMGFLRLYILIFAAGAYGAHRIYSYLPHLNPGYYAWLKTSPWQHGQPLPLGPLHLVWEDAVLLLSLVAFSLCEIPFPRDMSFTAFVLNLVMLFGYSRVLTGFAFMEMQSPLFVLLVAITPLGWWPWGNALSGALVVIAMNILLDVGLPQQLKQFPWKDDDWIKPPYETHRDTAVSRGQIGWPWDMIGPHDLPKPFPMTKVLLIATMVAWWAHTAIGVSVRGPNLSWELFAASIDPWTKHAKEESLGGAPGYCWFVFCSCVAVIRLLRYTQRHLPPIGFFGRFATGRLILPAYDKVFVAPILVIIVGLFGPAAMHGLGVPVMLIPAASIWLVLMVAMATPPALGVWKLTGQHRITVTRSASGKADDGASDKAKASQIRISFTS